MFAILSGRRNGVVYMLDIIVCQGLEMKYKLVTEKITIFQDLTPYDA